LPGSLVTGDTGCDLLDGGRSTMNAGSATKEGVFQALQTSVVNPLVRLAWRLGISPPGDALLETTGRHTGRPRRTPMCDGLEGDTFWLIAQRGRRADWVRNIEANPRVRVKGRSGWRTGWRTGTAHVVDDDPRERRRILARGNLARSLCVNASGAMGTSPLTVRIDLDPR
jgi:deazaflavin-dependent oxidoreductase (nitroreductase family)